MTSRQCWLFLHVAIATITVVLLAAQSAPAKALTLNELVFRTMQAYFDKTTDNGMTLKQLLNSKPSTQYKKNAGVFVTLSSKHAPRACWGSVYPTYDNLAQSTIFATIGALTKDYRYKPIREAEWRSLKTQVTVIRAIAPITSIRAQNPLRDGLMLRSGNKTAILLPGEAKDAYYQLIRCQLKAGLHKGEPYQLYRLKADIYE